MLCLRSLKKYISNALCLKRALCSIYSKNKYDMNITCITDPVTANVGGLRAGKVHDIPSVILNAAPVGIRNNTCFFFIVDNVMGSLFNVWTMQWLFWIYPTGLIIRPGDNHHIIGQSMCIHGRYSWHKTSSVGYISLDLRLFARRWFFCSRALTKSNDNTVTLHGIQFNIVECTTDHGSLARYVKLRMRMLKLKKLVVITLFVNKLIKIEEFKELLTIAL